MGIMVSVFRAEGKDCTLGGVSSKHDKLTVVNVDGPFEPDVDAPAVRLENHVHGSLRLVPVEKHLSDKDEYVCRIVPIMGGNYAATSDSRFNDACRRLLGFPFYGAVAIHDRDMSKER